jgi:GntR family carbon starvation induced transcriptional regulator
MSAATDRDGAETKTDQALKQLQRDLLSAQHAPGKKLKLHELKKAYGTGFGALREALWRLSAEGLVVVNSRKGFQVSDVSREELLDLSRLRVMLECMALEEAIANRTHDWEGDIVGSFHRLSKYTQADGAAWDKCHKSFHESLVATCRSPVLQQIRKQLFDRAQRYRNVVRHTQKRDDLTEHRNIMEACLAHDVAKATKLMSLHFQLTTDLVVEKFDRLVKAAKPKASR